MDKYTLLNQFILSGMVGQHKESAALTPMNCEGISTDFNI